MSNLLQCCSVLQADGPKVPEVPEVPKVSKSPKIAKTFPTNNPNPLTASANHDFVPRAAEPAPPNQHFVSRADDSAPVTAIPQDILRPAIAAVTAAMMLQVAVTQAVRKPQAVATMAAVAAVSALVLWTRWRWWRVLVVVPVGTGYQCQIVPTPNLLDICVHYSNNDSQSRVYLDTRCTGALHTAGLCTLHKNPPHTMAFLPDILQDTSSSCQHTASATVS